MRFAMTGVLALGLAGMLCAQDDVLFFQKAVPPMTAGFAR